MKSIQTAPCSIRLYRSAAEVIRHASVELTAGRETLCIRGLSASASTDSMRLFSGEGIRLLNLRLESGRGPGEKAKELSREIRRLKQQNEIREMQKKLLEANGDFSERTTLNLAEITGYIDALPEKLTALNEAIAEAQEQIETLEKELETASTIEDGPSVIADVEVAKDGTYPLELRYTEYKAKWRPIYEIHTDGEGPLELRLRAAVEQTSGEDWENVALTILSGRPSGNQTLPKRDTEVLEIREHVMVGAGARMNMSRKMAMAGEMMMEDAVPEMGMAMAMNAMATPEVEEQEGQLMMEYELGEGHLIRSSDSESLMDLNSWKLEASYHIRTAPRLDSSAYLTADIKTADLPLLYDSHARVYLSNVPVGEVILATDASEDIQTLSLGKEERLRISVRTGPQKNSKTLLSGQNVREYVYETSIANALDHAVTVTVEDQIPVSGHQSVTVEATDLGGYKKEEGDRGYLVQERTLGPKESITMRLAYKVSWPKGKELSTRRIRSFPKFCPECGSTLSGPRCTCGWQAS